MNADHPDTKGQPVAANDALRTAHARMESMLESLNDAFCAVDYQWRITYINGRALEMLSLSPQQRAHLIGKDLWLACPDLEGSSVAVDCRNAMQQRVAMSREFYYPRLGCWLEMRLHPSPDGLTLYFQDITARRRDQQALIANNNRLQLALAAGRLGDWRWDAHSDCVTFSTRAAAMLDLPAHQPLTWPQLRARLHHDDRVRVRRAVMEAFARGTDLDLECRLVAGAPSSAQCISLVGRPDFADLAEGGAVLGMTGMAQDISIRRAAEDQLRASQEQLQALADTMPQLAWIAEPSGAVVWFNRQWYAYTGSTPEASTGWGWQSMFDPDVLPTVIEHWAEARSTGEPFAMEFPIRGADGQYRWFLTRFVALHDAEGKVVRWFGTNTDVDEVKRAEQALREESHILELLNSTGSALAATRDLYALMRLATDAAANIAGARHASFFHAGPGGDGTLFLTTGNAHGNDSQFHHIGAEQARANFRSDSRAHDMLRYTDLPRQAPHTDCALQFGLDFLAPEVRSYLSVPVVSRAGKLLGRMQFGHPEPNRFGGRTERIVTGIAAQAAIAIDNIRLVDAASRAADERRILLENERQARAEAERTSRLKDEFLATLSHELRTPLSAILGWSQILRRSIGEPANLERGMTAIERNARAQARLIEDLLDMSRISTGKVLLEIQPVVPMAFVEAALDATRPAADAKEIEIVVDNQAPGAIVAGDSARLQQVVWNLLTNAVKFSPRAAQVKVAITTNGQMLAITVSDSGAGVPPDFLEVIFDRFRQADASSSRRYGGLGIGLSIVKHLVEQHGGTVSACSDGPDQGASFTVELPLARLIPEHSAGSSPSALAGMTVLVVGDDRLVCESIARMLADHQASVRLAGSATQALATLRADPPDLFISDLGGSTEAMELMSQVQALPVGAGGGVPGIALTASGRTEHQLLALEAGYSAHVSKPVDQAELMAAIAIASQSSWRRERKQQHRPTDHPTP